MLINDGLVRDVMRLWEFDQNHPHRGRDKKALPPFEAFVYLLEMSFRASLIREEGRDIQASLVWLSPESLYKDEVQKYRDDPLALKFDEPLPLEPAVISKLGACADGITTMLLVNGAEDGFSIWGLLQCVSPVKHLNEIPVGMPNLCHGHPDQLTVTIKGAGNIYVSRGGFYIARIEGGECRSAEPTPIRMGPLSKTLLNIFDIGINEKASLQSELDVTKWSVVSGVLEYLVHGFSRYGAAGTFIIVPSGQQEIAKMFCHSGLSVSGSIECWRLIEKIVDLQCGDNKAQLISQLCLIKAKSVLRERLDTIIKLCSMDGAVLLDHNLGVLAFGAKLRSKIWGGQINPCPGYFGPTRELDFSRLGSRHASAKDFVGAVPGSVSFVASKDGPVRAMTKIDHQNIMYWADCRDSMFL